MSDFEDQLRAALRRPDAPAGLAERVIERTRLERNTPAAQTRRPIWRPVWAVAAMAATITFVSFSVATYQHAREERAARQAELALRIAAEKLNVAFKTIGEKN